MAFIHRCRDKGRRHAVRPASQSTPSDRQASYGVGVQRAASKARAGSAGTEPSGLRADEPPGRRTHWAGQECSLESQRDFIQTRHPHPHSPLTPRRPRRVTSGKGGAQVSKSPRGRRLLPRASQLPGRRAGPRPPPRAPRGVADTHRAWPPCRPRRAGSPCGRAPPAGRCCPPRRPAARAAAALCSAP